MGDDPAPGADLEERDSLRTEPKVEVAKGGVKEMKTEIRRNFFLEGILNKSWE